jgi:SAM-dependent methyltransferase
MQSPAPKAVVGQRDGDTVQTSVACRFCGETAPMVFTARDWNRLLSEREFTYYRCPSCALTFLDPLPADLDRYYPPEYYPMPGSLAELAAAAEAERYKIDLVRRFQTAGRLLEIGPATGAFAYLAKQAGFDVDTIEMDAACCRFLEQVVRVRAFHSADAAGTLAKLGGYDAVAMWHVIEHLSDPWQTLDAAADRLHPRGILLVATPNPSAFQFGLFGRYWAHLDAPRHLELIPAQRMRDWGTRAGLTLALETTTDAGGLGWNLFGWQESLANVIAGRFNRRRTPTLLGRSLSRLMRPIERGRAFKGTTYTLVFQRPA